MTMEVKKAVSLKLILFLIKKHQDPFVCEMRFNLQMICLHFNFF